MTLAKHDSYDIVVVGTGAAGTAAALEAAQHGASVLLLEKGRHTGGSSNYTEGLLPSTHTYKRPKTSTFPPLTF